MDELRKQIEELEQYRRDTRELLKEMYRDEPQERKNLIERILKRI